VVKLFHFDKAEEFLGFLYLEKTIYCADQPANHAFLI